MTSRVRLLVLLTGRPLAQVEELVLRKQADEFLLANSRRATATATSASILQPET